MPLGVKHAGEVLDVLEKWVPDRQTRSALLTDLLAVSCFRSNRSFRVTVDTLIRLHANRHLNKKEAE